LNKAYLLIIQNGNKAKHQKQGEKMKKISWKLQSGKEASVSVSLKLSEIVNADGQEVEVKRCEMEIVAEVEGMGVVGHGRPVAAQEAAAKIGKLGIAQENLDKIESAIKEIENDPEWIAKMAAKKAAREQEVAYEKASAKVRKAMNN